MKLRLHRDDANAFRTHGRLFVNDVFTCYTLEDPIRPIKIPGTTAIPDGTYIVLLTYSNRFKRPMPLLRDVPGFEGVRIHPGNAVEDTEGCILVGQTRQKNTIGLSRAAYAALLAQLTFPSVLEITSEQSLLLRSV